eukprot:TRINITY_DN32955_c0_g1_i1.p1 TRINITY_DN32955_c0_g1~~TRINITY_DN32955_c0_g1_i1.p1  ORF type:complete len:362 (+),score=70.94 TRINITY_DN32955_c0_g1_i1:73-1158(+)
MARLVHILALLCTHASAEPNIGSKSALRRNTSAGTAELPVSSSKRRPLMRSQGNAVDGNYDKKYDKDLETVTVAPDGTLQLSDAHVDVESAEDIEESFERAQELERICGLASWGSWSTCTETCGSGQKVRTRDALGLLAEHFTEVPDSWSELNGKKAELVRAQMTAMLVQPTGSLREEHKVAVRWSGQLIIQNAGRYEFSAEGAKGVRLKIGTAFDTNNADSTAKPLRAWLGKGRHSIVLSVLGEVEGKGMNFKYSGPDTNRTFIMVPSSALRHEVTKPHCKDSMMEIRGCNMKACAVNCMWGDWSAWSACTKTCGGGISTRTRHVAVQALFGGAACSHEKDGMGSAEQEECNSTPCPWIR